MCLDPREYSNSLTALCVPEGFDADKLREVILERFDMSLGTGLGKLKGNVFRIGHLGDFNDLMLCDARRRADGADLSGIPHGDGVSPRPSNFSAPLDHFVSVVAGRKPINAPARAVSGAAGVKPSEASIDVLIAVVKQPFCPRPTTAWFCPLH